MPMVQVPMWVNGQSRGEWSFMAFCSKPGFITDDSCNQPVTRNTQVLLCSALLCSRGAEQLHVQISHVRFAAATNSFLQQTALTCVCKHATGPICQLSVSCSRIAGDRRQPAGGGAQLPDQLGQHALELSRHLGRAHIPQAIREGLPGAA